MTPAELERLNSWAVEIVEALVEHVKWRQEGEERRALNCGGLTLNLRKGCWYSHAASKGGVSVLPLIRLLKGCSHKEAMAWGQAWLRAQPGTGSSAGTADDEPEIDSAAIAQELLAKLVNPFGTPAGAYLNARGLHRPLPPCVRFLPNARIGEGALAGILTSHGRITGIQVTYLDPAGRKSTVQPARRRFNLEKAADAVFEIQLAQQGDSGLQIDALITEGLEDGLSLRELDLPVRIIALPGIAAMASTHVGKGERIVVVRDGDEANSPADNALIAGLDHLLLEGASVQVTATPQGEDANSILQAGGAEALAELLSDTCPAELSIEGEFTRLARLDSVEYDRERKPMADRLGIRLPTLDHEVGRRRSARPNSAAPDSAPEDADEIELVDEPIELRQVLDETLFELQRYIVADETFLAAVTLWCAHTHLCHHEHIRLQRSPRLAVQARTPGSGKTTLLEAIGALVPRPRVAASLTASTVLRVVDQRHPALLIDEADRVLHDQNSDLLSILNAGDRRATAWVERSVPTPDGGWEVKRFSVWGAVAFAGIDELPPTQQDRSIVIQLQKALDRDIPDHLEDGTSAELVLLKRKLATWSHDLEELPRPVLPDLLTRQAGRIGDNWRVLFGIAQLAGGRWPELVKQAALEAVKREGALTVVQRLLESVHRIFQKREADAAIKADDKIRITTPDLIAALLADDEDEWGTANRGRAVTWYWLRDNLRHLLTPPGTKEWEGPASGGQRGKRYRGYLKAQFERAWERHLPSSFLDAFKPSTGYAGSAEEQQNQGVKEEEASAGEDSSAGTAGATADAAAYRTSTNGQNPSNPATSADTVDTADGSDGYREEQQEAASNGAARPNGQAEPDDIDDEIRAYAKANPKKTLAAIAKRFGQPRAVVAELLGRSQ